ncbi:hypothetical protein I2486_08585 [Cellulophaga sp. E16_2]|uniref:hypothetical protein n=1 Tax=Cellulophaga sp. E16_2 TaxID=2789297 RepID=UPI001A939982|nr:hypothetical protein [Cellulophaga sp. E16_2]MBO0591463.1 hypothetical protein [Cellulophaga sp. E16_2]
MIDQKINKELLKFIRLYHSGTLILENEKNEIVPEEFTHNYLLTNFDIPQIIREYYFFPCCDMLTDEDYQKFVSIGYIGNPKTTLSPYPFCYKGAFIPRKKLFYQLMFLIDSKDTYKGKSIEKLVDLFPYFEDYNVGFKDGYDSFEEECINKFMPMFADKSDFVNKVFEYLTKEIIFRHSWRNNHSGFKISMSIEKDIKDGGEIIEAYEEGKFQGYFYKAWSLLFSNSKLFENLFIELLNSNESFIQNDIVNDVLNAAHTMQQNMLYWNVDEDTRTKQVLELLHKNYYTKDQPKYGRSTVGKKAGSVDGVISINGREYFIEAFNLDSLKRGLIKTHIDKLENYYDSKGLKEKFIVIYYNLKTNTFPKAIKKYKDYITDEHTFIYPISDELEEIEVEYTDSRLFKTYHEREGVKVVLYHLLLKFPK